MKRFYCSVCKKIKRVRRYPDNVTNIGLYSVTERVGSCNFHNPTYRRPNERQADMRLTTPRNTTQKVGK